VYEALAAQARTQPTRFLARPECETPKESEFAIIGVGPVDLVDIFNRRVTGSFGIYIKEIEPDGNFRLAYIHPGSLKIKYKRCRNALVWLKGVLEAALKAPSVEFGLRGTYASLAKKTLLHVEQLPSSFKHSCVLFNKQWD